MALATMAHFTTSEWQRVKNFYLEIGVIGLGFTVLVTILAVVLYRLGGQFPLDKLTSNPYIRFIYACIIKPHDKRTDGGQQGALESFYSAQVGSTTTSVSSLAYPASGECL